MRATELRLGNIENRKYWNPNPRNPDWAIEPCIIHAIGSTTCNVVIKGGEIIKLHHDKIEPVPLTPDTLEKCGFQRDSFNAYNLSINHFDRGIKILSFSGDYLYLRERSHKTERADDYVTTLWNKDLIGQFYLHELQNIHHALMKKDLKIKL